VDDAVDAGADERLRDRGDVLARRGLPDQQGVHLDGEDRRHDDQEDADERRADGVPVAVRRGEGRDDAEEREDEAEQRGGVLEEDDGQLGRLRRPDELHPGPLAPAAVGLLDRRPERHRLEPDRDDEHDDRDPPPAALDRLRVLPLVVRLVEGEEAADAEQDDRDDEGARLPPTRSRSWLPESATEWIDSASIELDWVSRNATNLVIAMPRFATSAARIALVPPSVDMRDRVS
jgi:hypothetical protein